LILALRSLPLEDATADLEVPEWFESQPTLDDLMQRLRRKKFDVLAVWSLDRLARSLQQLLTIAGDGEVQYGVGDDEQSATWIGGWADLVASYDSSYVRPG